MAARYDSTAWVSGNTDFEGVFHAEFLFLSEGRLLFTFWYMPPGMEKSDGSGYNFFESIFGPIHCVADRGLVDAFKSGKVGV